MKKNIKLLILISAIIYGCSSDKFKKSKLDVLAKEMDNLENFTIILYDMDVEGSFSEEYKHQYKIIYNEASENDSIEVVPKETITDWYIVSKREFDSHINDMGMEVLSKTDNVLNKHTSPPGYSNYVGNAKYGEWKSNNSGNSFWHFYGQYAFISSMMGLASGPIYRNNYANYNNYRASGRSYYGNTINGAPEYGTNSRTVQNKNSTFYKKYNGNSSFKESINNRVQRSNSKNSRVSRSSSRTGNQIRSRSYRSGK